MRNNLSRSEIEAGLMNLEKEEKREQIIGGKKKKGRERNIKNGKRQKCGSLESPASRRNKKNLKNSKKRD